MMYIHLHLPRNLTLVKMVHINSPPVGNIVKGKSFLKKKKTELKGDWTNPKSCQIYTLPVKPVGSSATLPIGRNFSRAATARFRLDCQV